MFVLQVKKIHHTRCDLLLENRFLQLLQRGEETGLNKN